MALGRERWKRVLLAIVVLNLIGGYVFVVAVALVPSWIVYPTFLIIGSVRLAHGDHRTGIAFLTVTAFVFVLVHLPLTRFGPEGSRCAEELDCDPVVAWITLTLLPLALLVAGELAWRDVRRESTSAENDDVQ